MKFNLRMSSIQQWLAVFISVMTFLPAGSSNKKCIRRLTETEKVPDNDCGGSGKKRYQVPCCKTMKVYHTDHIDVYSDRYTFPLCTVRIECQYGDVVEWIHMICTLCPLCSAPNRSGYRRTADETCGHKQRDRRSVSDGSG